MSYLTIEHQDTTAILTMQGEETIPLAPKLVEELIATLSTLENKKETRAIVLTSNDAKSFCSGLDLKWMMQHQADFKKVSSYLASINELYAKITVYPKPVIAALNGHTFAAGLFLAAHCDFRIMRSDRGWICLPEVDINIPLLPGMIAICEAIMPPQSFRQLYYTGKRFDATESMAMGIVDQIAEQNQVLAQAISLANDLGKKRNATYAEMKKRIREPIVRLLQDEDPKHFLPTLAFAQ